MMKSFIASCLMAFALLFVPSAQAQIKYGLKLGVSSSYNAISKLKLNDQNITTYFAGPTCEVVLPGVGVGADLSLLYAHADVMGDNNVMIERINTLQIPINVKWTFGLGSMLGGYIAAGPQYGFHLGEGTFSTDFDDYIRDIDNWTANVGVGVRVIRRYQVGVNYNFPLRQKSGQEFVDEMKASNSWQFSLTCFF